MAVVFFIWAIDGMIAVNRWWTEDMGGYLDKLTAMTLGFFIFSMLVSRSRLDFLGFVILSISIFFTGNYEIGGPSKFYLTPFDPLLGRGEVFRDGLWMGISGGQYRYSMAMATGLISAAILTFSRIRQNSGKTRGNSDPKRE